MHTACLSIIAFAIAQTGAGERPTQPPREAHMPHCLISLIDEAQVPAEQQGVLTTLNVREGANVRMGQTLAQIDDRQARIGYQIAVLEFNQAEEEANNEVDINFYRASEAVAHLDYDEVVDANKRNPGTFSDAEVRRYELQWKKAKAQVEQGMWNKKLAGLSRDAKRAEVDAAKMAVEIRQIDSPLDGIVYEVFKHQGEWVQPGEPIVRVVRMDRLRVEGFLRSHEFAPEEINGREATVTVKLARGQTIQLKSRISFVSPLVEPTSGEYRVSADITNAPRGGFWVIRPGLSAEMTVHLR
jgi:multidrug efflux pump subunit AcrA (membrane-fusion protein)